MTRSDLDMPLKYVNRKNQIKDFLLALDQIRVLGSIFQTIYEYHGGPGIGKSTLLKMLMEKCEEDHTQYALIDFARNRNLRASEYSEDISTLVAELLLTFDDELTGDVYEAIKQYHQAKESEKTLTLGEVARNFQRLIKKATDKSPVVLFFDETEQADQDLVVPWLEEWIINPLAQNGRCLFVWAGRRPQRWKRFEVRRRVCTQELDVFDEDGTEALFKKNSKYSLSDLAIPVRTLTGGHPYADTIILRYLDAMAKKGRKPEKTQFNEIVPSLLDELTNDFIYKFAFLGLEREVIQACEVMSLVRQFDIIMLRDILSEAIPDRFGKYERNEFGSMLSKLRSTQLVLWDDRRKGYALDPNLRHIIGEHIHLGQPELYAQVNRTAIKVYRDWIQRAGDNRGIYIVEELYQQACLNRVADKYAQGEKKDLVDLLKQRIGEYSQSDLDLRASALNRLYHELDGDPDLPRLIDTDYYKRLVKISELEKEKVELEKEKNEGTVG